MMDKQQEIQKAARKLLEDGTVSVVIGYQADSMENRTSPVFIRRPEDAEKLVWNKFCLDNLARYLTRPEIKDEERVGIIAKGCDIRAIIGLIQEAQLPREKVFIIAVSCDGMGEPLRDKCNVCEEHTPQFNDMLIGKEVEAPSGEIALDEMIARLGAMSPAERWEFWKEQFSRCIRCYACRQACPLCYCETCIAEKNQPQMIPTSIHGLGQVEWNVVRAFHLAGRCIECGECERVCPMGIPLMLINRKIAKQIKEDYEYVAGKDPEEKPPLTTYKPDDEESFIK